MKLARTRRIFRPATFLASIAGVQTFATAVLAGGLPTGGQVVAGSAKIGSPANGALTITQTTQRAVVNWSAFSVGQGQSVNFQQPNAGAATLNRVTGSDATAIAGTLTANGSVYVVNPNGVQITPSGQVNTGSGFVASTLGISNKDFMAGKNNFSGQGGAVVNQGKITTGAGGEVVLLGSTAANQGTIEAPIGKVALGSGAAATLDVNGDGFLQVMLPAGTTAADGTPLVSNSGTIRADGGTVVLKAATVQRAIRDAVNMPGTIRARSVSGHNGAIVLDGGAGGTVELSGTADVSATKGATSGGTVSVTAGPAVTVSGNISANGGAASNSTGGRIDVTGNAVTLQSAQISATGTQQGGLVRLGGAFQGGRPQNPASSNAKLYVGRFGNPPALAAASTTAVDAGSNVNVSATGSTGVGGTAIVWSNQSTMMQGRIAAAGAGSGGAVEVSSESTIQSIALGNIHLGTGGTLLLDPEDIIINNTAATGQLTGNLTFATNATGATTLNEADIVTLLSDGTSLMLQANRDITWTQGSGNVFVSPGAGVTAGNLTLQAGRSVTMSGAFQSGGGSWTIIGNDPTAIDADDDRSDLQNAQVDLRLANFQMLGGNLTVRLGGGAGSSDYANAAGLLMGQVGSLSPNTNGANNVTATVDSNASTSTSGTPYVELTAPVVVSNAVTVTGNIAIIPITAPVELVGQTVNWTNETTGELFGSDGSTFVEFIANGLPTLYGIVEGPSAATQLTLAPATTPYTRQYGDADPTGDQLLASTTLESLVAAGSFTVTGGPGVTGQVGSNYSLTLAPSTSFAFQSLAVQPGTSGYFVNLAPVTIPLTITQRPLTPTVSNGSYTYGSPTSVVTLSGLVNGDAIAPVATLNSTTGVTLSTNGGGFGFSATTPAGTSNFTLTGITGTNTSDYSLNLGGTISGTLTIAQKALTYSLGSVNSTYGTAPFLAPTLTGIVGTDDVGGVVGLTSSGNPVTLANNTPVGSYTTTVTGLSGTTAGNYTIASSGNTNGALVIGQKTITYSIAGANSTYGTLATPSISFTGVLAGDNVTGTPGYLASGTPTPFTATTPVNGGTPYSEILTGISGNQAGDYQLATSGNSSGLLVIAKKTITVVGGTASQVYGTAAIPAPVLTGAVSGDDVSALQNVNGANLASAATLNVGSYYINPYQLTGSAAGNYTVGGSGSGTLSITQKPLTYQVANASSTYGTLATLPTPVLTGIINGDSVSGTVGASNGGGAAAVAQFTPAGTYTLGVAGLSGSGAGNYSVATSGNTPGTLTVAPLPITWNVANTQVNYGDAATYSATLTSILNGDSVTPVVTATGTGGTVTTTTGIGTYTESVTSLSGPGAGNYSLAPSGNTTGTLTIVARPLTYSVANASSTYGTLATPGTVTLNGVVNGDSVGSTLSILSGSSSVTLAARTAAGTYTESVTGLTGNPNYTLASSGNTNGVLTIAQLPLTFSAPNASSTYGTAAILGTGTVSGMLSGDNVSAGLTTLSGGIVPGAQQAAGSYSLVVSTLSGSDAGNYTVTAAGSSLGTLMIAPKTLTYSIGVYLLGTPTGATQPYGNLTHNFYSTGGLTGVGALSGVVGNDAVNLSVNAPMVPVSTSGAYDAGTYTWTGASLTGAAASNYVLAGSGNSNATLTITPISLPVQTGLSFVNSFGLTYDLSSASVVYGSNGGYSPAQYLVTTRFGLGPDGGYHYDNVTAVTALATNGGNLTQIPDRLAAGTYSVVVTGLTGPDAGNYVPVTNAGTFTVTPKPVTMQVTSTSSTYGTLASVGVATISGVLSGDDVSPSAVSVFDSQGNVVTLAPRTPAGSYAMGTAGLTGSNAANYKLTSQSFGTLSINPIILGYAVDQSGLSQVYGSAVPLPTLTGILSGDSVQVVPEAEVLSSPVASVQSVGAYPLTSSTVLEVGTYRLFANPLLGPNAGDYALPSKPYSSLGTITITPKPITAAISDATTVYGTSVTPAVTFTGLINGQTVSPVFTTTNNAGQNVTYSTQTDAGQYIERVTGLSGASAPDYAINTTSGNFGNLVITPKTLTLSVNSAATSVYGSPAALGTLTGVLFGDDVEVSTVSGGSVTAAELSNDGSGNILYAPRLNAGAYNFAIANGLTGAKSGNYTLANSGSFSGALTVAPKPLTYTIDNATVQYGGYQACDPGNCPHSELYFSGGSVGSAHLSGILTGDSVSATVSIADLAGNESTLTAATPAGNYLEIVTGLTGSSANNYMLAQNAGTAGVLTVEPQWVTYSTTSAIFVGGIGTGIIGTPGVVTLSDASNDKSLVGVVQAYDPNGNPVYNLNNLIPGTYTFPVVSLTGADAANYRVFPAGGTFAGFTYNSPGTLTVFANDTFGLSYVNSQSVPPIPTMPSPTPAAYLQTAITAAPIQQGTLTTQTGAVSTTTVGTASAGQSGTAVANGQISTQLGQANVTVQGDATAQDIAKAGVGGVTEQGTASANTNVTVQVGSGYVTVGLQADVSESVKITPLSANLSAGAMAGGYVQGGASGSLGSAGTGSASGTASGFVTAQTSTSYGYSNGKITTTETEMVGAGASAGGNAGISGSTGSVDAGATVYSPGVVGAQFQDGVGYSGGTLSVGLNMGAEVGLGGVDVNVNFSINTNSIIDPIANAFGIQTGPSPSDVLSAATKLMNAGDPGAFYNYVNQNLGTLQNWQYNTNTQGQYNNDQMVMQYFQQFQTLQKNLGTLLTQEQNAQNMMVNLLKTNQQEAVGAATLAPGVENTISVALTSQHNVQQEAASLGVQLVMNNGTLQFEDAPPQ